MSRARRTSSLAKRIGFALIPVALLLAGAEAVVRVAVRAVPALQSVPLPPESAGLFRSDPDLFWSLRPSIDRRYLDVRVVTNTLGLRSPEIAPKAEGEYRILSLGESTTFGSAVEAGQTYTARLAALLAEQEAAEDGRRSFTAINAGVPAYSSFQSLKYFELRGLALDPDLLVFYHEVNDYLPSSLRDSSNTELGVLQTDWQLWEARRPRGIRSVAERSALVRFLRLQVARRRVAAFDREDFVNPLLDIGLPDIGLPPRMMRVDGDRLEDAQLNEASLGQRVSEPERRRVFESLARLAREHGVDLLLVHPSYQASRPHECVLSEFARTSGVAMLDAGPVLHPQGAPGGSLFRDSWHPRAIGHERLARALAARVRERLQGGSR